MMKKPDLLSPMIIYQLVNLILLNLKEVAKFRLNLKREENNWARDTIKIISQATVMFSCIKMSLIKDYLLQILVLHPHSLIILKILKQLHYQRIEFSRLD